MNYKVALFFVAKCLTISLEEKNRKQIENQLKTSSINWEDIVKLSTSHYVLPALYCNLKRADFLKYLPSDLVEYMQYITDLNRERNKQIITQAKELNQLLLSNNITPVFLKGTCNIVEGLYEDIAERMVGDIDFIFSEQDYPKAIQILKGDDYNLMIKQDYYVPGKHYPRLIKQGKINAIEIHKYLLIEKYSDEFNYTFINKDVQKINTFNVLSFENQLTLSIAATQINDYGFHYKRITLRNAYDVFLLSKKSNAKKSLGRFGTLTLPLNCFLATCYVAFGEINTLEYDKTDKTEDYLKTFNKLLINDKKRVRYCKRKDVQFFIINRLYLIYKSFLNKPFRMWLINLVTSKEWQGRKLIQLGLKKKKFR
ncbi:nucleotidyltransferase family protein [Flavobacteriaceae bacterium]|nr:nucleotidyltransferase family protein [Flavobacteriaceae bacterium]